MSTKPKELKPLIPPDPDRCQAKVPGNGPFTMGGPIGNPKNGYRVRCENRADVIITEDEPGPDGLRGSMSLCAECLGVLRKQQPAAKITAWKKDT